MKLLVCDVEGTIFQSYKIESTQHASYIWTAIAGELGPEAKREEIKTQEKWQSGGFGSKKDGQAYTAWVQESIYIHAKYKLDEKKFTKLIDTAPYVDGVKDFFARLSRNKYIPVLISGGIQNLNEKACHDLAIDPDNSYAACKYYFNDLGRIDKDLTFSNTCNFYGKQEIVNIALRKYGLCRNDWVFIGDGINDVSVAKNAPVSIGIAPSPELKAVVQHSFNSFTHMMAASELMEELGFFENNTVISLSYKQSTDVLEAAQIKVNKQIAKLHIEALEKRALGRLDSIVGRVWPKEKRKFTGIKKLLEQGEISFALTSQAIQSAPIVSALLQPFSNAAEIMIYVCLALTDTKSNIDNLLNKNFTLRQHKDRIKNTDLKAVIEEYIDNRNISAHTGQEIPIDAARTFIRRTYEIIQRLELIINPSD